MSRYKIKKPKFTATELNSNIAYGMTSVNNINQDELDSIQWLCEKSMNDDIKITYLQSQLAEKEKEIEQLKYFKVTIGTMENNQVDISSTTYIDQDKISGNKILLVEDGSVDIDKLEEDGFYVIVYRQGANPPMWLPYQHEDKGE